MILSRLGRRLIYGGSFIGTVIGSYVLINDLTKTSDYQKVKLKNGEEPKTFLITGANTGIGRALSWDLASLNHKVYMLCRDMKKCEETRKSIVLDTKNKYVYCRYCDLDSQESIRNFADEFKKTNKSGIDGLCNNAGIMQVPRSFTKDGVEKHFGVNHLGHVYLTELLEDLIKVKRGRVVFLMNLEYRFGNVNFDDINFRNKYDKIEAFRQSQLANMMFVHEFAETRNPQEITVNAAYPGVCNTYIKRHMSIEKSFIGTYISGPLLSLFTRSAEKGAQTPLKLLIDPELNNVSGKLFSELKEISVSTKAKDSHRNRRLMLMDEYWCQLKTKDQINALTGVEVN